MTLTSWFTLALALAAVAGGVVGVKKLPGWNRSRRPLADDDGVDRRGISRDQLPIINPSFGLD